MSQNYNSLSELLRRAAVSSCLASEFRIRGFSATSLCILRMLAMKRREQPVNASVRCGCFGPVVAASRSGRSKNLLETQTSAQVDGCFPKLHHGSQSASPVKFSLQMAACTLRASSVVQLHLGVGVQNRKCRFWQETDLFFNGLI